ncbi:TetR/AcrR family transcriptional regulator [uncultured Hoeflea sp.]|uniref:TetR/AcrR family transcriptional regulator n=1 Tax=uncultured Hoeflea sp. TaxID=538666 RepID=UPI0030EC2938|tara:strand:+ start:40174 stop:40773 length:600 start_codon:yes stop_codon:yes gene_type:complete
MRDENKATRQEKIEQAAYAVLEAKGYAGASMLAIAKAAKASNETLYNWYGDKTGLFKALVLRNAEQVKQQLEEGLDGNARPLELLQALGPRLLALLVSPRAVQLNRAAAADPTGELGAVISERGRETVAPLIGKVMERARVEGDLVFDSTEEAVGLYLNLLVGDLQIRRVIGRAPPMEEAAITQRANQAFAHFMKLCAA